MSRFYARGSDSESESSSDEEVQAPKQIVQPTVYLSEDEEEVASKRVVKSARDKRYEEMHSLVKKIRTFRKNNDMSNILDCFENLTKAHQKALPVIMKEEKGITPTFYLRILAQLELYVNTQWENKKTLSKINSKSLATMRQKLRKYIKDFDEDLVRYRENPELLDEDEDEEEKEVEGDKSESSDDSEAEVTKEPKEKKERVKKVKIAGAEDDESDDSYWGDDTDETSSSSDENEYTDIRERFLKKTTEKEEGAAKLKKQKEREMRKINAIKASKVAQEEAEAAVEDEDGLGGWEVVKGGVQAERPKMFGKDQEINVSVVMKKLAEITAVRGKKGTDRKEQIELLIELEVVAKEHGLGPAVGMKIGFGIVAAIFDYSLKVHEAQKVMYWIRLLEKVNEMLGVAIQSDANLTIDENIAEDGEQLETAPYKIRGCLMTVFERLDEEFLKVLKELDSHSFDYLERVQDEKKICEMLDRLLKYLESTPLVNDKGVMCRAYYKKIEHMYYKFDVRVLKKKRGEYKGETSVDDIQRLAGYVYAKDTTDRLRTRAILCHIYHHAMHDNWFEARDLILMSHLQEVIHHSDPATQIMYNRAMVQLGICAFRHENIQDAHNALTDLMMSGRVKELLAQGLMPQHRHDRSPEQEKIERSRQVPFHMQLNLDVIECVYLASAMLIEVPYLAEHEFDAKRRPISKTFYHQLRTLEKQSLTGPPESMREHVVAAARAMKKGDWQKCYNCLVNEKMDKKVWHCFAIYEYTKEDEKLGVKEMLRRKIREESLRTYLFTYSHVYDSVSLPRLATMYDMEYDHVHSIVAKMIINQELMASMDEPSKTIVLHRTEPTRLQSVLLQVSDKINILRETSDRNFETKIQGGPGTMGPGGKGRQFNRMDWKNRRNNQGGGRGRGGDRDNRGGGDHRGGRGGYRGRGGDRGDRGDRDRDDRGDRGDRDRDNQRERDNFREQRRERQEQQQLQEAAAAAQVSGTVAE